MSHNTLGEKQPMGKVIITAGNYSKTPYVLKNSKLRIHSIEELAFCILKNPELCEDFLYDRDLPVYIENELGLRERASRLAILIERGAPVRDLMTVVFCSSDYMVKDEIEEFINEFSRVENSEEWVRVKNKADSYLQIENYKNALINYRNLIKDANTYRITNETLGDIYHNMGVATLHTAGFTEAADCFREAYERNNRNESLKSYLLALKFGENDEEYRTALDIYKISDETAEWMNSALFHTELEAEGMPELVELSQAVENMKAGKVKDFSETVDRLTEEMKEQYRRNNE